MGRLDAISVSTLQASRIDEIPAVRIGAGCTRRDLSSDGSVRVWVVEMEPGSIWPYVDDHDTGEHYYVIEGEVIEGHIRFHVVNPDDKPASQQAKAAQQLIEVIRSYVK